MVLRPNEMNLYADENTEIKRQTFGANFRFKLNSCRKVLGASSHVHMVKEILCSSRTCADASRTYLHHCGWLDPRESIFRRRYLIETVLRRITVATIFLMHARRASGINSESRNRQAPDRQTWQIVSICMGLTAIESQSRWLDLQLGNGFEIDPLVLCYITPYMVARLASLKPLGLYK